MSAANIIGKSKKDDIMCEMKKLMEQNEEQARQILIENPTLARDLFHAQKMLGMVQPTPPSPSHIAELAEVHPGLMTFKTTDLSPASWISVAWYPIYQIPTKGNHKDRLSTCFLTYHALSSSSIRGGVKLDKDGDKKGKLDDEIWINGNTFDDYERIIDLYNAAKCWLKRLNERRPETSRAESRRRGEEAEKPRPEKPRRRGCETKSDNEIGDRRRPERVRWRSCETERGKDTGEKQRARDG
nr:uncharacterized protein LOC109167854 [Ipomoea batatas]